MRNLDVLKKQAIELGVAPASLEGLGKKELEQILATALQSDSSLPQIEVMLAQDMKDLDPREQQAILTSSRWVAEEKLDGNRAKVHVTSTGLRLDGRRKSDKTYQYVERTENFPQFGGCKVLANYVGMVLDAEVLMTSASIDTGSVVTSGTMTSTTAVVNCSPEKSRAIQAKWGNAKLFVFDLIRDTDGKPCLLRFKDRRAILEAIWSEFGSELNAAGVYLVEQHTDAVALQKKVLAAGGEGIMLKDVEAPYAEGKRAKTILKLKRVYTVDGWISGFVPAEAGKGWQGLVGAFEVSVYDEKTGEPQVVGACQPGTLEFRRWISAPDGSLRPQYYGQVVELRGNAWTKNMRLFHCTLQGFRPDKNKEDCRIDFSKIDPATQLISE